MLAILSESECFSKDDCLVLTELTEGFEDSHTDHLEYLNLQ